MWTSIQSGIIAGRPHCCNIQNSPIAKIYNFLVICLQFAACTYACAPVPSIIGIYFNKGIHAILHIVDQSPSLVTVSHIVGPFKVLVN